MAKRKKTKPAASAPVQTPCTQCPLRKLATFREFSAKEFEFMRSFKSGELRLEAGNTIFVEGTNSPHLYTMLSGWALKYKTLEDGRRQVLNFALPGDFLGPAGLHLRQHRATRWRP